MLKSLKFVLALLGAGVSASSVSAATTAMAEANTALPAAQVRANSIFDEAAAPGLANDPAGRLAIYRRALAALDADSPPSRNDAAVRPFRMLLRAAIAVHMIDGGEQAAGIAQVARLLPEARAAQAADTRSTDLATALSQLLRATVRTQLQEGNVSGAIAPARESLALATQLSENAPTDQFRRRSLAIDHDQLAALEFESGNRAAADRSSRTALDIFRDLAAREPESRPAQGSVLIALTRRIMMFNDIALLDEAERQLALMERRGLMAPNYAPIRTTLAEARRRNPR